MEFGLCCCGDRGDYNGVGLVKISKLFAIQNAFLIEMILFGRVYIMSDCHRVGNTFTGSRDLSE